MKLRMVLAGSLVVVIVAGCSNSPSDQAAPSEPAASAGEDQNVNEPSPKPTPSPEPSGPTSYWDILVGADLTTKDVCDSYQKIIAKYETASGKRNSAMKGKFKDAYAASGFKKGKSWLTADFTDEFDTEIQAAVVKALNSVSGGKAGEVADITPYKTDSVQLCGLSDRLAKAQSSVKKAQDTATKIVAKAATRPWYAKGYSEYSDGLAYKYTTFSGGDPCGWSRCSFGKVTVQSRDGCYGGLYGEMNFLDSNDNIRDWDIDSVPAIYPGEKATLDFISYSFLGSGTIRLVSLSCY